MLANISWENYSIFILVMVCIYYAIVFIVFYKTEIMSIITRFNSENHNNENNWLIRQDNEEKTIDSNTNKAIEQLQNEIIVALQNARTKKLIKDEIMLSLQLILHNYDSIRQSKSGQIINNYIKEACENICSISLENEEADRLWFR
jgi:hypothetical protein